MLGTWSYKLKIDTGLEDPWLNKRLKNGLKLYNLGQTTGNSGLSDYLGDWNPMNVGLDCQNLMDSRHMVWICWLVGQAAGIHWLVGQATWVLWVPGWAARVLRRAAWVARITKMTCWSLSRWRVLASTAVHLLEAMRGLQGIILSDEQSWNDKEFSNLLPADDRESMMVWSPQKLLSTFPLRRMRRRTPQNGLLSL